MANKLELPEDKLMKLGFRLLDITYGELTIRKGGSYWDEVFVNKDNNARLGYRNLGLKKGGLLGYLYKDKEFFLNIIPVERDDYLRVLRDWMLERYNREVDATDPIAGN